MVFWESSSAVLIENDNVMPVISPALYLQRIYVFIIIFKHVQSFYLPHVFISWPDATIFIWKKLHVWFPTALYCNRVVLVRVLCKLCFSSIYNSSIKILSFLFLSLYEVNIFLRKASLLRFCDLFVLLLDL